MPVSGDPLRFAGKELDPETAMAYFGARYYRQTWGRFATIDPLAGDPSDPQSFDRYIYSRNNPLRFVDPSGMKYIAEDYDGQLYEFDTEGLFNEWCYLGSYDCAPDGTIYDAGRGRWGAWKTIRQRRHLRLERRRVEEPTQDLLLHRKFPRRTRASCLR